MLMNSPNLFSRVLPTRRTLHPITTMFFSAQTPFPGKHNRYTALHGSKIGIEIGIVVAGDILVRLYHHQSYLLSSKPIMVLRSRHPNHHDSCFCRDCSCVHTFTGLLSIPTFYKEQKCQTFLCSCQIVPNTVCSKTLVSQRTSFFVVFWAKPNELVMSSHN